MFDRIQDLDGFLAEVEDTPEFLVLWGGVELGGTFELVDRGVVDDLVLDADYFGEFKVAVEGEQVVVLVGFGVEHVTVLPLVDVGRLGETTLGVLHEVVPLFELGLFLDHDYVLVEQLFWHSRQVGGLLLFGSLEGVSQRNLRRCFWLPPSRLALRLDWVHLREQQVFFVLHQFGKQVLLDDGLDDGLRLEFPATLDFDQSFVERAYFAFHVGVPVVLDVVVSAAIDAFADDGPLVAVDFMVQVQHPLFVLRPLELVYLWVQVVVPSLPTLLPDPAWQVVGNVSPLHGPDLVYQTNHQVVFVFAPGSLLALVRRDHGTG